MKEYVLARKWRPKKFSEVVGQDFAIKSIASGLKAQKVHHAYLLTGPRGIGKTTIARIIAKAINCETNGVSDNPCGNAIHVYRLITLNTLICTKLMVHQKQK